MKKLNFNLGGGASSSLKAFTLAEVLITLAIIGVVAALTIPSVVTNYQNQEIETRLKSTYSTLSNVTKLDILEHGFTNTWNYGISGNASSSENFINTYMFPYLKIAKNCGRSTTSDCLYVINNLHGQPFNWSTSEENFSRFYLADGTAITVYAGGGSRIGDNSNQMQVYMDTNGWKGPNKLGIDVHQGLYKKNVSGKKSRQKFHIPYFDTPLGHINGAQGCSKSAGIYAGLQCTGLIFYYSGGKIPTKQQYINMGGKAEDYPW